MNEPRGGSWEIEDALISLGERVNFPAEPNLAAAVHAYLETQPAKPPRSRGGSWTWPRIRPALVTAILVACIVASVLVFSPTTRRAVADWIGLDGVRITFEGGSRESVGTDLLLGERVSLGAAQARVPFPVRIPDHLGVPDEVYVMEDRPAGRVSLLYRADDELPRTAETGVGLLVSQFRATIDREIVLKKIMSSESFVGEIEVAGAKGYWLAGGPHVVTFLDANGSPREDQVRLAGNTLLWQRNGVVYRIESDLSQQRAVEIANSMF